MEHPSSSLPPASSPVSASSIAIARLKAKGLRITKPRLALIALMSDLKAPTPIDALHRGLEGRDLVTVYRNMEDFEKIGIVERSFSFTGTSLFKLTRNESSPLFVISRDGKALPLDKEISAEVAANLAAITRALEAKGYSEISPLVQFFADFPEDS